MYCAYILCIYIYVYMSIHWVTVDCRSQVRASAWRRSPSAPQRLRPLRPAPQALRLWLWRLAPALAPWDHRGAAPLLEPRGPPPDGLRAPWAAARAPPQGLRAHGGLGWGSEPSAAALRAEAPLSPGRDARAAALRFRLRPQSHGALALLLKGSPRKACRTSIKYAFIRYLDVIRSLK